LEEALIEQHQSLLRPQPLAFRDHFKQASDAGTITNPTAKYQSCSADHPTWGRKSAGDETRLSQSGLAVPAGRKLMARLQLQSTGYRRSERRLAGARCAKEFDERQTWLSALHAFVLRIFYLSVRW
jgi:hypothetical protein